MPSTSVFGHEPALDCCAERLVRVADSIAINQTAGQGTLYRARCVRLTAVGFVGLRGPVSRPMKDSDDSTQNHSFQLMATTPLGEGRGRVTDGCGSSQSHGSELTAVAFT